MKQVVLCGVLCGMLLWSCTGKDLVDRLIADLGDRSTVTREIAAKKLGVLGPKAARAVGALRKALSDPGKKVRRLAAEALGKIGEQASVAIPDLCGALEDKDVGVRRSVAKALGHFASKALAPVGEVLLKGRSVRARVAAASAMGHLGKGALKWLGKALSDREGRVRFAVLESLKKLGSASVPLLLRGLEDKEVKTRAYAVWVLSKHGERIPKEHPKILGRVVSTLEKALGGEDKKIRLYAALALASLGSHAAGAVKSLEKALSDEEWFVRKSAAGALGAIGVGASSAISSLLRALEDEAWDVKKAAGGALVRVDQKGKSIRGIVALLKRSRNARVRAYLVRVLGWMGKRGDKASGVLVGCLGDPAVDVRLAAADVLRNKRAQVQKDLRRGLRHRQAGVRAFSATLLGRLGPKAKASSSFLRRLLRDRENEVRRAAARALSAIQPILPKRADELLKRLKQAKGGSFRKDLLALGTGGFRAYRAMDFLEELLQKGKDKRKRLVLEVLGWLSGGVKKETVKHLVALFRKSKDPKEREGALRVLGWMGPRASSAISDVMRGLRDDSVKVRLAAVFALEKLGHMDGALRLVQAARNNGSPEIKRKVLGVVIRYGSQWLRRRKLAKLFKQETLLSLGVALKDGDWQVRERAMRLVGELGYHAMGVLDLVNRGLKDRRAEVRRAAAVALGWMGLRAKRAVPSLEKALKDRDAKVRRNVIFALGRMGEKGMEPLLGLVRSGDKVSRTNAVLALGRSPLKLKLLPRVLEAMRALRGKKGLSKDLLRTLKRVMHRLRSNDKPEVFWVEHPRSPTLEVFSPALLRLR